MSETGAIFMANYDCTGTSIILAKRSKGLKVPTDLTSTCLTVSLCKATGIALKIKTFLPDVCMTIAPQFMSVPSQALNILSGSTMIIISK